MKGGYKKLDDATPPTGGGVVGTTTVLFWMLVFLAVALLITTLVVSAISLANTQSISSSLSGLVPTFPPLYGSCPVAEVRRQHAFQTRMTVAYSQYARSVPCQYNNQDEQNYPTYIGQFTKGMLHDAMGVVVSGYYPTLLTAVATGAPTDFLAVLRAPNASRQYVNPQAGLYVDLVGGDAPSFTSLPAPSVASAQAAAEYIELSWMALARDVSFDQYGLEPITTAAIAELNLVSGYTGTLPVTASNLFRSKDVGAQIGPYLSQFFYLNASYGPNKVDQQINPPVSGIDFMTSFSDFLSIQNGELPSATTTFNGTNRYMINGRDLTHYVHIDMLFQAYHIAGMILLGIGAPYNPTNPYLAYPNQIGFSTFGGPFVSGMVTEIANRALHATWYQKWFVHRRLRPEAYGGLVDRVKNAGATFPVHTQALTSVAGGSLNATYGSYLLPQAFPEGSPLHPSYAAGHATVAAACVTVLKALFDGSYVLPNPVQPDVSGATLVPFVGPALTVEHELNKLASNIGVGRNIAGVHYRSDYDASVLLGEQVAIQFLKDLKTTFNEGLVSWTFKDMAGATVYI